MQLPTPPKTPSAPDPESDAEKERKRLTLLLQTTSALSHNLSLQDIFDTLVCLATDLFCGACCIDLLKSGKPRQRVAASHIERHKQPLLKNLLLNFPERTSAPDPVQLVIDSGKSSLYPEMDQKILDAVSQARGPGFREVIAELGLRATIIVNLRVQNKIMGSMCFFTTSPEESFGPSELSLAEELAQRASAALDRAHLFEKMQEALRARDELISICSHELFTPLTTLKSLMGLADLKIARGDPEVFLPENVVKVFNMVTKQTDRLTRLVKEMLDVSRINLGKMSLNLEETDLSVLALDVVERIRPQFEIEGMHLSCSVEPKIIGRFDPHRLEQALLNLLDNARKYGNKMPCELRLYIKETNETDSKSTICLTVSDKGLGITPENQERIFQRFERASSSKSISGLGIGLFIVKQIVESHLGTIQVQSKPGQGTCFEVNFPLLESNRE